MTSPVPGIGVMLQALFGKDNETPIENAKGRIVKGAYIAPESDGALIVHFEDGAKLTIRDDGRSCCEARYMDTDDDLQVHNGRAFVGVDVSDGPEFEDKWGNVHEQQFLRFTTTGGTSTIVTHNEHNGYYGGFWIKAIFQTPGGSGMSFHKKQERHEAAELTRHIIGTLENAQSYFDDAEYLAGDIGDREALAWLKSARQRITVAESMLERALYYLDPENAPIRTNQPAPPNLPEFDVTPTTKGGRF